MIGAILGAASAVYGAYSARKSAKGAQRGAARQAELAAQAEEAQLDFAKEQYQDWKDIYGGFEENLGNFYSNLSPESLAVRGLEEFEAEKDRALTQVRETLAQRGIGDSGLAGKAETDFALMSAEERAQIRADAPMKAAQEKAGFLSLGIQRDPRASVSGALQSNASTAGRRAETGAQLAGTAAASSREATGKAITGVANFIEETDLFGGDK